MKNRIELTIEHKDHYTVELTNEKGDTFIYNPQKHEGLEDFLSGAKVLLIADVRLSLLNKVKEIAFGDGSDQERMVYIKALFSNEA